MPFAVALLVFSTKRTGRRIAVCCADLVVVRDRRQSCYWVKLVRRQKDLRIWIGRKTAYFL